jgi:hypothetical protein
LIAACIGNTAPNASAITINKSRDCILKMKNSSSHKKP